MSTDWLDLSNVSNILRQTYINGFLDVSSAIIGRNDVSFNKKLFVSGDASLNSRLTVEQDSSFNNNIFVGNYVHSATPSPFDNSNKLATTAYVQNKINSLTVPSTFYTDINIIGRLSVTNDVSMSNLVTFGDVSFNKRLYLASDASINGNIGVSGIVFQF